MIYNVSELSCFKLRPTDQALLYVITGKGLHSKGEVRIKPAVINYLKSTKYRQVKPQCSAYLTVVITFTKLLLKIFLQKLFVLYYLSICRFEELPGRLKVKLT